MTNDALVVDVSQDWMAACDVQRRFMQSLEGAPEGLDCGAQCRQLRALGGDCYEFTRLAQNRLAMAIGDASGKGLSAAMMISSVQSALRTAAFFAGSDLAAALAVVNRQVYASSFENRYATLFYGVVDGASRELRYANAGHNPPIVIRRDGSIVWLKAGGAPVGMFPDWKYEECTLQLAEGDVLLGYTDGIIEAVNPSAEEWGIEGLRSAAAENREKDAGGIVNAILAAMETFSRGCQTDDATIFAVRIN